MGDCDYRACAVSSRAEQGERKRKLDSEKMGWAALMAARARKGVREAGERRGMTKNNLLCWRVALLARPTIDQ